MKRLNTFIILILSPAFYCLGQIPVNREQVPLPLNEYLAKVARGNLGFIAEKYNVSIAEAQLKAAKVFPDPEFSVSYSNNEDQTLMMGQGVDLGVSYPISLGNKRGAAVALAKSQYRQTQAVLDVYFQNLRAEAAISYFSAIKQKKLLELQEDIYNWMKKLADADSLRLAAGTTTVTDALQTALEARRQKNNVFQADAGYRNALNSLSQILGKIFSDTLFIPSGDFPLAGKDFQLPDLVKSAIESRPDLQMARMSKEVSEKQVLLVKSSRAFEFSLDAGYSHSTVVKNEIAPAPAFDSYNAGATIPLKFSTLNKGELTAAKYAAGQSEAFLADKQNQVAAEVARAFQTFRALGRQVSHYQNGLIEDAQKILEARTYAYQRGETGLVDLLNAQHTFSDLKVEYYEILYQYTESLIEMEKTSGIWDFE